MGSKRPAEAESPTAEDVEESAGSPPVARRPRISREEQESRRGRDKDDDDDEESMDDDEEQQTMESPLRRVNKQGREPEAGIISKVYVENFMCHRKFSTELCSNVNFIHGQNGSGKSAILAAIQICLGAGARRTHRARNLKDLVRKEAGENCSGAKVRVTILNGGEDAFEKEKYGKTITVERTISLRGGYNGYKLLDQNMKEVSRHKKDLDAMLDQLNIQVENPVAVLDQEEAKKFLTGKAEDKYSFFMKATELERIDRSYAAVTDNLNELITMKQKVEESMKPAMDNVRELKKEWEKFQELDKLQDKVDELKVSYAWAYYNELKAEVDEKQEKLDKFMEKREKRLEELTQIESLTNGPDEEKERRQELMDQLIEESNKAADDKKKLESELKRALAPVKHKQRELESVKKELRDAEKNLKNAKKFLHDEREKIRAAAGSAQTVAAERAAKLEQSENELAELRENDLTVRQTISESQRKYEELEPRVEGAKEQANRLKNQVTAVQHKVRELGASGSDSLAMYGPKCASVHKRVEAARQNNKFRGEVIGPIGAHIKIANGMDKFAAIAELAINTRNLDRYIVTNDADRRLFMKIREDAGCNRGECSVWQTSPGARYNVPAPPAEDVETVASCLNISNDLVFNVLVDQCRIDQRALADSKETSERSLLIRDGQGREAIRGNIKEVYFLPHGDYWKVNKGARSMISRDSRNGLNKTIGADRTAALKNAKEELAQLETELKERQEEQKAALDEQKEHKVTWNKVRKEQRKAEARMEQLELEISDLKAATEESTNVDMDTTELEEDVANAEQVVEATKERVASVEEEMNNLAPAADDIQTRLNEVTARNTKVIADMQKAEESLEQYMQVQSQQAAQLEKKRAKVQQIQEIVSKQESTVNEIRAECTAALQKARALHFQRARALEKKDREDAGEESTPDDAADEEPTEEELEAIEPQHPPKESSYYKTKAERTKKKYEEEKVRRALKEQDPAVAYEKYNRAKNDLTGKLKQIEQIEANEKRLTSDLKDRKKRWKQFQEHISNMTDSTFDEILNTKGSSGQLEFDHAAGTLNLVVQKDNTQESSQTKDVKALSGGERSFTTLALLLALGERLETPFRVMDEFDVFLDPVSRKIAMEQLVLTAQEMKHRQFIFITPQDVSSLTPSPSLKIIKMKPPAKSDRVGGPTQQTLEFGTQSSE